MSPADGRVAPTGGDRSARPGGRVSPRDPGPSKTLGDLWGETPANPTGASAQWQPPSMFPTPPALPVTSEK